MKKQVTVQVLRVFTNHEGKFGNPVGIVLDEAQSISPEKRQIIATNAGFSELVFINDLSNARISIFSPIKEVNFAGHALVGAAFFISATLGKPIASLICKAGSIQTWQENNLTWIQSSLTGTPPWHHEEFSNVSSLENLTPEQLKSKNHTVVWTWIDKNKSLIRARTFASDWGIPEDEANGSGSMQLSAIVRKSIEVHHGRGSVIFAKSSEKGFAAVGGRVAIDTPQEIALKGY